MLKKITVVALTVMLVSGQAVADISYTPFESTGENLLVDSIDSKEWMSLRLTEGFSYNDTNVALQSIYSGGDWRIANRTDVFGLMTNIQAFYYGSTLAFTGKKTTWPPLTLDLFTEFGYLSGSQTATTNFIYMKGLYLGDTATPLHKMHMGYEASVDPYEFGYDYFEEKSVLAAANSYIGNSGAGFFLVRDIVEVIAISESGAPEPISDVSAPLLGAFGFLTFGLAGLSRKRK